jgi:transposase-like protein
MTIRNPPVDPGRSIVIRLGGVTTVAPLLGVNETTVYRWLRSAPPGGNGYGYRNGLLPEWTHKPLLTFAREQGIDLVPEDFWPPTMRPVPATERRHRLDRLAS